MELYYAEGPQIVRDLKARGHKIFLDLKLHDIPNTVKKAMAVLSKLDVDMTNLHAGGTRAMMEAALEGLTRPDGTRPLLIAVTQLTSTSPEAMAKDLLIEKPWKRWSCTMPKMPPSRGWTAWSARLSSRGRAPCLRQGIFDRHPRRPLRRRRQGRPGAGDDPRPRPRPSARTTSWVGRPITAAADPVAAYERCLAEFVG